MKRREFLKCSSVVMLGVVAPGLYVNAQEASTPTRPASRIKKGIVWSTIDVKGSVMEKLRAVKQAGFQGVEMLSHMNQDEVVRARDEIGLEVPVVGAAYNWSKPLSSPDPGVREEGLEGLKQALRDAKRYGASCVLQVPGVVNKDISYSDAWTRSRAEIRKAIPLAEELGVKIAIENVWNQFLLSPLEAARYVDEFQSPMVGWNFDVGNIVNFGFPEQWIRILGKRIQSLHIKEYSRKKRDAEGPYKGFDVALLEGDNNWPEVMKAVHEIGYTAWAITEQPGGDSPEGLKDLCDRLAKILSL